MTIVYRRLCVTEVSMVKAIGFSESFANASEQSSSLLHPCLLYTSFLDVHLSQLPAKLATEATGSSCHQHNLATKLSHHLLHIEDVYKRQIYDRYLLKSLIRILIGNEVNR